MINKPDASYHTWPVADAKQKFSTVVDQAQRGIPQIITSHGKPQVVMINITELPEFLEVIAYVRKKRLINASKALRKAAAEENAESFEPATDIGAAFEFEK